MDKTPEEDITLPYVSTPPMKYKKVDTEGVNLCGLTIDRYHRLDSLFCRILVGNLDQFLEGIGCSTISSKLANNMIRVASSRIFADPINSFIEPIVNSIDSYKEASGIVGTGKFGMGFFSLMYWIPCIYNYIQIDSIFGDCYYRLIILNTGQEFQILIDDSGKLLNPEHSGTRISIYGNTPSGKPFPFAKIRNKITSVLSDVHEYPIELYCNGRQVNVNQHRRPSREPIIVELSREKVVIEDFGMGIPIDILLKKMLVPAISTKTIAKFLESPTTVRRSKIEVMPPLMFNKSEIMILVGEYVIYRDTIELEVWLDSNGNPIPNPILHYYIYLDPKIPMPVSRDDIILSSDWAYQHVFEQIISIIMDSVRNKYQIDPLLNALSRWSQRTSDVNIQRLLGDINKYLRAQDFIVTVPKEHHYVYSYFETMTSGTILVPSDYVTYGKLFNYISSNFKGNDKILVNKIVIELPNFLNNTGMRITEAGTPQYIFMEEGLTIEDIIQIYPIKVMPFEEGYVGDPMDSIIETIVSKYKKIYIYNLPIRYWLDMNLELGRFYFEKEWDYTQYKYMIYANLIKIATHTTSSHEVSSSYMFFKPGPFRGIERLYFHDGNFDESTKKYIYPHPHEDLSEYSNFLIEYVNLYSNASLNLIIYNDTALSSFLTGFDSLSGVLSILSKYHPIYSLFISMYNIINNEIEEQIHIEHVEYMAAELAVRYPVDNLIKLFRDSINSYTVYEPLMKDMYTILNTKKTSDRGKIAFNNNEYLGLNYRTIFTAKSLIKYLFEHDVDINDITWLFNIPKLEVQFESQIIDISVNDGTSRGYIDAILTEMIQNSIDAVRGNLDSNDNLEILIGQNEKGRFNLTVTDYVGIPTKGIISMMIPFLSTKGKSNLSTGEMGSGFMSLYRQPWCDNVNIITYDPISKKAYQIIGTPLVNDIGRVYDIKYELSYDNMSFEQGRTSITVNTKMNKDSSLIIDSYIYGYTYIPYVSLQSSINHTPVVANFELIHHDSNIDIYMSKNKILSKSVIFTNMVPFGDLTSIVFDISDISWFKYAAGNGLMMNFRKEAYRPVQTRKKIYLPKKIRNKVNASIVKAAMIRFGYMTTHGRDGFIADTFNGINYQGPPGQVSKKVWPDGDYEVKDSYNFTHALSENILPINNYINHYSTRKIKPSSDDIQKDFPGLNIYIAKSIEIWISNKDYRDPQNKSSQAEPTEYIIKPSDLTIEFEYSLIKHVWETLYPILTINNLKIRKDPPKLYHVDKNPVASGFYNPFDHSITLVNKSMKYKNINDAVNGLKGLSPLKQALRIRDDPYLSEEYSSSGEIGTLIHELLHALTALDHEEKAAHDPIEYVIGKVTKKEEFGQTAINLWRIGMKSFYF